MASCFNDISTNLKMIKALVDQCVNARMGRFKINTDILCILVFCVWALVHTAILPVTVSDLIFYLALPDFLFPAFYSFVIYTHMSMHTNATPHMHARTHTHTHTHTHTLSSLSFGEDNVFWAVVCVINYLMNEDDAKAKTSQEAWPWMTAYFHHL